MNCGEMYEDDSDKLIDGCECGSSLFMYESEEANGGLDEEDEKVVEEVEEMVAKGVKEKENIQFEFDIDSISVEEEGVYNINVSRLLEEMPLVIQKSDGVYHIHLPSAFSPESSDLNVEDLGE
ncbi:MAG: Zn-ribbon containing protein [Candidatus Nanohaloarchaea archaeon]